MCDRVLAHRIKAILRLIMNSGGTGPTLEQNLNIRRGIMKLEESALTPNTLVHDYEAPQYWN